MAIKQDFEFRGVPVADAYYRINQLNLILGSGSGDITIDVYASADRAKLGLGERLDQLCFSVDKEELYIFAGKHVEDPDSKVAAIVAANPLEWAYKWLMLKPEFEKGEMV